MDSRRCQPYSVHGASPTGALSRAKKGCSLGCGASLRRIVWSAGLWKLNMKGTGHGRCGHRYVSYLHFPLIIVSDLCKRLNSLQPLKFHTEVYVPQRFMTVGGSNLTRRLCRICMARTKNSRISRVLGLSWREFKRQCAR